MRSYAKLAIFMIVLLFSVSMLSVAIDWLGELKRVDINIEMYNTVSNPGTPGMPQEGKPAKGKGASLGDKQPLFEIIRVPETQYLRWMVDEIYNLGNWEFDYERTAENYYGGEVYDYLEKVQDHDTVFIVNPLFNLTEFYPVTYPLNWMSFDQIFTGYYYRDLKTFFTVDPLFTSYTINHPVYSFSETELREATLETHDEYLEVPTGIESQLIDLANRIVIGYSNPYDKLKALENYLKDNYNYTSKYERAPNGTDTVEYFLFHSREGVCSHFNSAFVLLARVLDIPARIVKGFSIKPYDPYQIVLPKNAHMWAEVHFRDYGWITFDATPVVQEERPSTEPITPTVCNITYNDPVALKGEIFNVVGTVITLENEVVNGVQVEVFLNVKKDNKNGVRCGVGETVDGVFNISCIASTDLKVMDYNLIAHALPSASYDESWSDPPIRIMAETNVTFYGQNTGFVNDTLFFSGLVYESISGEPIVNNSVKVNIEDEQLIFTTDEEGMISLSHRFITEGNKTIELIMDESKYYLSSNTSFGVSIDIPPETELGILEMLTTFPNNLLVFGSCLILIGAVYIYTQRKPSIELREEEEYTDDEDLNAPITFSDYKEGVVKIFNKFYKLNRRKYRDIKESMTPREFQYSIIKKIPPEGKQPLEYLITAFEIADYSLGRPTKDMFDKCEKAVELLLGLMKDELQEE